MFIDIQMLREYALSDEGWIRYPQFFVQSVSMGDRQINTSMRLGEHAWDQQQTFDFFDAVVAQSPEVARAIMEKMASIVPGVRRA